MTFDTIGRYKTRQKDLDKFSKKLSKLDSIDRSKAIRLFIHAINTGVISVNEILDWAKAK